MYNLDETVLADVHFRFNTEQREHKFNSNELDCSKFIFDGIESDDYDYLQKNGGMVDSFICNEYELENSTERFEGYHYKAHYPIILREFGSLKQGSHKDIRIVSCRPRQANGMFIEVVSSIRTGASSGDIVFLCNEDESEMIPLTVNSVQSNVRFLLNPLVPNGHNKNIFEIIEGLLHSDEKTITQEDINNSYVWLDDKGITHMAHNEIIDTNGTVIIPTDVGRKIVDYNHPKYKLRLKNKEIPSYAYKIGTNLYLWKDILNVGDNITEYPFANGHFYINKNINFFLERQDPFKYNGLYKEEQIPNDIFGNVKKISNYVYKGEENKIC